MTDDRRVILGVLDAYHAAMVEAHTDELGALLDDDYSLAHPHHRL